MTDALHIFHAMLTPSPELSAIIQEEEAALDERDLWLALRNDFRAVMAALQEEARHGE